MVGYTEVAFSRPPIWRNAPPAEVRRDSAQTRRCEKRRSRSGRIVGDPEEWPVGGLNRGLLSEYPVIRPERVLVWNT